MKRAATIVLLAAVVCAVSASAARAATVKVSFVRGEQMTDVARAGSTVEDALGALLRGPTAAEARSGIRTYVPRGTTLLGVAVADEVATIDLSREFVAGRDEQSLLARLSQVVFTATGVEGVTKVRLKVDGETPPDVFPGVDVTQPLTVEYLRTPNVPVPVIMRAKPGPVSASVRRAQARLASLGFLPRRAVDGRDGPVTQAAVLAFQKWEGLTRDGKLGPQTLARLRTAKHPLPFTRGGSGRRAEVLLDRQVALAIEGNRVVRVVHVSTGKPSTPTPPGAFRVQAKVAKWWSTPFREWLLWAVPFNGGIAIHQFADVPPYPASHGCVRNTYTTAQWLYEFARVGMPVTVLARST